MQRWHGSAVVKLDIPHQMIDVSFELSNIIESSTTRPPSSSYFDTKLLPRLVVTPPMSWLEWTNRVFVNGVVASIEWSHYAIHNIILHKCNFTTKTYAKQELAKVKNACTGQNFACFVCAWFFSKPSKFLFGNAGPGEVLVKAMQSRLIFKDWLL
jgi:hypothetical protein